MCISRSKYKLVSYMKRLYHNCPALLKTTILLKTTSIDCLVPSSSPCSSHVSLACVVTVAASTCSMLVFKFTFCCSVKHFKITAKCS